MKLFTRLRTPPRAVISVARTPTNATSPRAADAADAGFTPVAVVIAQAAVNDNSTIDNDAAALRAESVSVSVAKPYIIPPRAATTAVKTTIPTSPFLAGSDDFAKTVHIPITIPSATLAPNILPVSHMESNDNAPAKTPIITAIETSVLPEPFVASLAACDINVNSTINAPIEPTHFKISPLSIPAINFIAPAKIRILADIPSIITPSLALFPPPGNLEIPISTPYNTVINPIVIIPLAISPLSIFAIILIAVAIRIRLAEIAKIPTPAT